MSELLPQANPLNAGPAESAEGGSRPSSAVGSILDDILEEIADRVQQGLPVDGIVHRDVKPGNLMVDRQGKLWITDFGLAQIESAASLTTPGDLLGTLRYMSPEQALAKRVAIDYRTDIYSTATPRLRSWPPTCGGSSTTSRSRRGRRGSTRGP